MQVLSSLGSRGLHGYYRHYVDDIRHSFGVGVSIQQFPLLLVPMLLCMSWMVNTLRHHPHHSHPIFA